MLELFRRNLFINSLFLLPYCVIIRIHTIIHPESYELKENDGPVNELVYSLIGNNALTQSILAIILIFISAQVINYLSNRNRLAVNQSLIPGLLYILLTSFSSSFLYLTPILIGNTFLILACINLFSTYKKSQSSNHIFNVGFLIGLASMFFLPFIVFLIAGYLGFVIMRSFKFKERMQYVCGFLISYFLLCSVLFYYDSLNLFIEDYIFPNISFSKEYATFSQEAIIHFAILSLFIVINIFSYNIYTLKKSIESQKKVDSVYWFLLLTIPAIFFWKILDLQSLLLLAFPMAVLLNLNVERISNKFLAETIHLLIVLSIVQYHFGLLNF